MSLSTAEQEVLKYLRSMPSTQDTLEGIAQWCSTGGSTSRTTVTDAVNSLLANGAVERVQLENEQTAFRLARRRP